MKSENLVTGTILVLLGLAFLGRNLGILPGIPWSNLWRLWPVFLIVVGLQVLFPKGKLSVLAPTVLIIAVIIALFGLGPFQRSTVDYGQQLQSIPVAERADVVGLTLRNVGVADLRVAGRELDGTDAVQYKAERAVIDRSEVDVSPTITTYYLYGNSSAGSRWFGSTTAPKVDIALDSNLLWHLDLGIGVGVIQANLIDVDWEKLRVDTGVGQLTVRVAPASWGRSMSVHNGVGSIRLELPAGAPVSLQLNTPSFMHNLERMGLQRQGDRYVSTAFEGSDTPLEIRVDGGLSHVAVHWVQ